MAGRRSVRGALRIKAKEREGKETRLGRERGRAAYAVLLDTVPDPAGGSEVGCRSDFSLGGSCLGEGSMTIPEELTGEGSTPSSWTRHQVHSQRGLWSAHHSTHLVPFMFKEVPLAASWRGNYCGQEWIQSGKRLWWLGHERPPWEWR